LIAKCYRSKSIGSQISGIEAHHIDLDLYDALELQICQMLIHKQQIVCGHVQILICILDMLYVCWTHHGSVDWRIRTDKKQRRSKNGRSADTGCAVHMIYMN
jgi:hypothetical protein